MSAAPRPKKLTPAEYLAVERAAAFRSEFFNGEMFATAGASYEHTRINDNFVGELHARLKGTPCFPLSRDMRVLVSDAGLYTYPDAVIVCGTPAFEDNQIDTLLNPRVIVEVLSDSTANYDRGVKFRQYQRIASFQEYVLISQDEAVCERFVRQPDGDWLLTTFAGLSAELALATVPVRVPLADVYAGVTFPPPPVHPPPPPRNGDPAGPGPAPPCSPG